MNRLHHVLFATALVTPLLVQTRASACSRRCLPTVVAPVPGSSLPTSAPGLPIQLGGMETQENVGFELRDAGGKLVTGSLARDSTSRFFFAPAAALAPGTYTARYKSDCESTIGGDEKPFFTESPVQVTAAQPLPKASGVLAVEGAARAKLNADTSSGSCIEDVDAATVDLSLEIDASAKPYLGVLSWETSVDGRFWWRSEGSVEEPNASTAHGLLRLFTPCDSAGTPGRHPGLTAGEHDVEVRAVLVGGAPIVPAKIRVKVTCGPDNGEVVAQQARPEPEAPAFDPPSGENGEPTAVGAPLPAEESAEEGCAMSPSRGSGIRAACLALGALVAAGVRRRRSRVIAIGR